MAASSFGALAGWCQVCSPTPLFHPCNGFHLLLPCSQCAFTHLLASTVLSMPVATQEKIRMNPEVSHQQQTQAEGPAPLETMFRRGCSLPPTHSHQSLQLALTIAGLADSHQGRLCSPDLSCSRRDDVYPRAGQNQIPGMKSNHQLGTSSGLIRSYKPHGPSPMP